MITTNLYPNAQSVTFNDGIAKPLVKLKANIDLNVVGGVPVPYTGVNLTVNGTTYNIEFPQEAGNVYYGDIVIYGNGKAKLNVYSREYDLGDLNWEKLVTSPRLHPSTYYDNSYVFYTEDLAYQFKHYDSSDQNNGKSYFNGVPQLSTWVVDDIENFEMDVLICNYFSPLNQGCYWFTSDGTRLAINDPNYQDASAFKAAMSGTTIMLNGVYPEQYDIDIPAISTAEGANSFSVDTGDITSVSYQKYHGDVTHARITFVNDNIVLTDNDIESSQGIRISSYMNQEEDMQFGEAFSREASVGIIYGSNLAGIDWRQEFKLEFGSEKNGSTIWTTVGYFRNNKPVHAVAEDIVDLTAYDRMSMFSKTMPEGFIKRLFRSEYRKRRNWDEMDPMLTRNRDNLFYKHSFPLYVRELVEKACEYVGVQMAEGDEDGGVMNSEVTEDIFNYLNGDETFLDMIKWIAELNGCYARINSDGCLQFTWFSNCETDAITLDETYDIQAYQVSENSAGKKWKDLTTWGSVNHTKWGKLSNVSTSYEILAVESYKSDDATVLVYPETFVGKSNIYPVVDNPFFTNDTNSTRRELLALKAIHNRVNGFKVITALSAAVDGNYLIEAGDIANVAVNENTRVKIPIYNVIYQWAGSEENEFTTTASTERNTDLVIKGRVNQVNASKKSVETLKSNSVDLITNQSVSGSKSFNDKLTANGVNVRTTGSANKEIAFESNGGTVAGKMFYSMGNTDVISSSRTYFEQMSPNTTADDDTTGYYERFRLPATAAGLASNEVYDILTSKTPVSVLQGGTGASTQIAAMNNIVVLSSPSNVTGVGITIQIRRWGRMTMLRFAGTLTANRSAGTTIATITDGYRPIAEINSPVFSDQNGTLSTNVVQINITTAGVVSCKTALSSGKQLVGEIVYISQAQS